MFSPSKRHSKSSRRSHSLLKAKLDLVFHQPNIPIVAEPLERRMLLSGSTFTVSTLADSGPGSLRQAIMDADAAAGANLIDATGVTGTISLASTLPALTDNITISGPGASSLTVNGDGFGSVFTINSGVTSEIEGLAIAGGNGTLLNGQTNGGGINNYGTLTVTESTISGNSAAYGGGIGNDGTLTISNSIISGNLGGHGGGIFNAYSAISPPQLTVTDSTISGNSARAGGGVFNRFGGTLTIDNSTISGNSSYNLSGGIYSRGLLTVTDSTISGNSAGGDGIPGVGGGVFAEPLGGSQFKVDITDCNISGNSASLYGGIYLGISGTLDGTIIAGNAGGDVAFGSGATLSGSNDLIGDGSDRGLLLNSLRGTSANPLNPMLSPLGNFGGPTQTLALMAGSPAIGAGANFPVLDASGNDITATDQRGFARPQGSDFDIGAYQSSPLIVNTLTDSVTSNPGILSLREAITDANAVGGSSTISFATGLAGTINLASQLPALSSNITIAGSGASLLTVNGGGGGVAAGFGSVLAIDPGATVEIESLTITGGTGSLTNGVTVGSDGGGILNEGTLAIADSTISGNSGDFGGGIFNDGTLSVSGSTVSGNYAAGDGGGTCNRGLLTVTNSTISGNSAGGGGGIDSGGTLTVTDSTISGNSAEGAGGINNEGGALTVIGSTISGNSTANTGGGGGIRGPATIIDSTISGNSASNGGGIYGEGTLNGTIVAANSGGDLFGTFSGNHDLIGDGSDGGVLNDSLRGTAANPLNPMLAPVLEDFGGPTQTLALLPGSPALGTGANFPVLDANGDDITATDQRGFPRQSTSGIDIGADQGALFPGDTNFDGTVNLTDLLTLLNNYGQTGKNWTQGDFNFDGTVNLTDLLALLNNYGQSANDASIATPPATIVTYKTPTTPFATQPLNLYSASALPVPSSQDNTDAYLLQPNANLL